MLHYLIIGDELVSREHAGGPVEEVKKEFEANSDEEAEQYAVKLTRFMHHWELFRRVSVHPHHHEAV